MSQRVTEFFAELDMNREALFKDTKPDAAESAMLMTGLALRVVAMGVGHIATQDQVKMITSEIVDSILALRDDIKKAS